MGAYSAPPDPSAVFKVPRGRRMSGDGREKRKER